MVVLTEKFRFIRDDVFLCPWVDSKTGKQKLVMQKINLETDEVEFEDSIDCIHAAITDISPNQFNEFQNDGETKETLLKKTLFIRSSENLKEINLSPKEKFKALKSWTAGIAELGIDALQVQTEIEYSANLAYPMIGILFRFLTKVDSKFITQYLSKIERECQFEGVKHKSSLIANLLPLLSSLPPYYWDLEKLEPKDCKILSVILSMNPPYELFEKNPHLIHLLTYFPDYFNNFHTKIIQKYSDRIKKLLEINVIEKKQISKSADNNNENVLNSNSTEEIKEILGVLWFFYRIKFKSHPEEKKILSTILNLDSSHEIFYSNCWNFELLIGNFPEIVISVLKSEKISKVKEKSLENIMKLIYETYDQRMEEKDGVELKDSMSDGTLEVLNFIFENYLDTLFNLLTVESSYLDFFIYYIETLTIDENNLIKKLIPFLDYVLQKGFENDESDESNESFLSYLLSKNILDKFFRDNLHYLSEIADSKDGEYFVQDFMGKIKRDFEAGIINDEKFQNLLIDLFDSANQNRFDQGDFAINGVIIIESIMDIDPPFTLFKSRPEYIGILTTAKPSFIPDFLKTINREITKDGVRDDKLFLKLINPILEATYYSKYHPYYDANDANHIKKAIFELNPPIEFYKNRRRGPHPFTELIESDYIEDFSKQKILKKLLKNSKAEVMNLIERVSDSIFEDFEAEFNRILMS